MKGLLKKEKAMFSQMFWGYVLVLGIWIAICVIGVLRENTPPPFIIVAYCYLFTGVIKLSFSMADNISKWDRTVFTLPYKRSDIVSVNYITCLQLVFMVVILHLIGGAALAVLNPNYGFYVLAKQIPAAVAMGLIPTTLFYPLMITQMNKPGNKPVLSVSVSLVSILVLLLVDHFLTDDANWLVVGSIELGIAAVLFIASWILSLKMIKNKDIT